MDRVQMSAATTRATVKGGGLGAGGDRLPRRPNDVLSVPDGVQVALTCGSLCHGAGVVPGGVGGR